MRFRSRASVPETDETPPRPPPLPSVDADVLGESERVFLTLLFNKYRGSLFRYLTGLVPSSEDAAELVQESYARLLKHVGVSQIEAVARSYLFQIATNLARDHFRRSATRLTRHHLDIDELSIGDTAGGPETRMVWDETLESIKQGIKDLPPMTRRVFLLSRFRNKTYPEIAALLRISTRSVERKMSEAMNALALRIGERP